MRALLTLGLIGAFGYPTNGIAESSETAVIRSAPIEVHSVVVDQPQVKALPHGSGDIWDLLESSGQLVTAVPTNRVDLSAPDLLKVNSVAIIRSGPFPSGEIVGIAPAGVSVQAAARYSEWVLIIDPWSWETGWIRSKLLAPYAMPSAPWDAKQRQTERNAGYPLLCFMGPKSATTASGPLSTSDRLASAMK
jgi:hypothetical protein